MATSSAQKRLSCEAYTILPGVLWNGLSTAQPRPVQANPRIGPAQPRLTARHDAAFGNQRPNSETDGTDLSEGDRRGDGNANFRADIRTQYLAGSTS
jgi:hypothetical protein